MNMFAWLDTLVLRLQDAGEYEVADAALDIPSVALDHEFERLEAIFPIVIGYARSNNLPWLEIYARHWRLQGYLSAGVRLGEMLPEAVSLFARTAQDDVRACPQSLCAVQDLSLAYEAVDAPGWAEERLAAVLEAAAKIDLSVPCSACLTTEAVDALYASGRCDEALRYGLDWHSRARASGVFDEHSETHFWTSQAMGMFRAAIALGEFDTARMIVERARPDDESDRLWNLIAKTRLKLAFGEADAVATFPAFQCMGAQHASVRFLWLDLALDLARAGMISNDVKLGDAAREVCRSCETNGQTRNAFNAAAHACELAILRGRPAVADLHLDDARRLYRELRGSHGADERIAALEALRETAVRRPEGDDSEGRLEAALVCGDRDAGAAALVELGAPVDCWGRLSSRTNAAM